MTTGIVHARNRTEQASSAARVDGVDWTSPGASPDTPPAGSERATAAPPAPVSLSDLARDAKARATTTTTRPRATTTSTTKKTATATPTSTTATTAPKAAAAPPPPSTTTTTAPATPLTTLLEKVVPSAGTVSGAVTRTDSGVASWFKTAAGTCAHRTLDFGTAVKVTRVSNGASATCKVNDRGPTVETGRLIDLSLDVFEQLADRAAGLVDVRIEW